MVPLVFLVALLYSAVGHAGASGYIAILTSFNLGPAVVKPTALLLNIIVAAVATWQFASAGSFSWRLFWPLAVGSVPAAFWGGGLLMPAPVYKQIVGLLLMYVAFRILGDGQRTKDASGRGVCPPAVLLVVCGAVLGFVSGLIGVGGGIFLTPLMVLLRWSDIKTAAGVSAAFILVNSVSGLCGFMQKGVVSPLALQLIPAALAGGYLGSTMGSRRLPVPALRFTLALVLFLAGGKFVLKL